MSFTPPTPIDAALPLTERIRRAYERIADVDRPEVWITLRTQQDALADALDFRCVQGVQPVLVLAPLGGDAPGTFEPRGGHPLQAVGEQRQAVFQVTHERF